MADIQRYLNLITSQHQGKVNLTAWLTALLNKGDDTNLLALDMYTYFDIETATGTQLDTIGNLIGVKRRVTFTPTGGASPILSDTDYRMLLKASIVRDNWDGTLGGLYSGWYSLFSDVYLIIHDTQDMNADVLVIGDLTQMQKDLIANDYIVPKPAAVTYNYSYSVHPYFAYDVNTDQFKGYGEGYWAVFV